MAISRKPKQGARAAHKEVDIDALISKGGSVAGNAPAAKNAKPVVPVIVRIPGDVLDKIDDSVQARRIKTPRNTWMLEAIFEKLERESD